LARTLDSLVVDEINRRYTPEIQNQILQNTTLMDEYRRWVEESEEALSRHSAATAALKQEVADVKARIEPFVARQAPTREWLPEIEATMKLWQNHVAGARDAEQKIDVWIHDYKLWLDKVSQIYAAADTLNMP
jgi:chromosome segregation ATPase